MDLGHGRSSKGTLGDAALGIALGRALASAQIEISPLISVLKLHGPFKRAGEEATSPVWAMFRARKKMAGSGHTDRAIGRDELSNQTAMNPK